MPIGMVYPPGGYLLAKVAPKCQAGATTWDVTVASEETYPPGA